MKVAFHRSRLDWIKKNLKRIAERFGIKKPKIREAQNDPSYVVVEEEK